MDEQRTSGGSGGMSGVPRWPVAVGLGLLGLAMAAQGVVNALSQVEDLRTSHSGPPDWQIWIAEATSVLVWMALVPVVALALARLRPPRLSWPIVALGHVGTSVFVSLLHVGGMLTLRAIAYRLAGIAHPSSWPLAQRIVYEYRKDAINYVLIAGALIAIARLRRPPVAPPPAIASPPTAGPLIVQDGPRRHHLALDAIDHLQAAGNYVEIVSGDTIVLHRATLAEMEAQLSDHGFVRIHRSRIVRRAAIRTVTTNDSGDFEVALISGAVLRGSRRYRDQQR